MKLRILMVILFAFAATNLFAKTEKGRWCGTKRGTSQTEYMIKQSDRHRKELQSLGLPQQQQPAHLNQDVGEIAVIEGSPSTIIDPNAFDLQRKKILLTETAGEYKLRVRGGSVASSQGLPVPLGDDASLQVTFTSGFSFPFFGHTYTSVFINSDGNLTFTEKDDASSSRDLFRTLQGPPRIAAFFTDLDPTEGGEVRVSESGTKFRVTWVDVPEFGTNNHNTIQVTLYRNGNIQIVYGPTVDGDEAIIGISPGNSGPGNALFVDYSTVNPTSGIDNSIIERFASKRGLDFVGILQEFHSTRKEVFELIAIFTDRAWLQRNEGFAFFAPVKNQDQGIGRGIFDFSRFYGSDRLEGFLMMDDINKYPLDVHENFFGTNNTLDIMGQEMGHRWLAFPRAVIGGVTSTELLGRDLAHWSWFLDSDASDMEGNNWQENGNNSFTSIEATERYSLLDRYIMGLIPASAVPPFFVLRGGGNPAASPQEGITITASKVDVTVNDIIAAEGPRSPTSATAKKKWRVAFIYFVDSGKTPDPALIARVDGIRKAWKPYFKTATGGNGKVITKIP